MSNANSFRLLTILAGILVLPAITRSSLAQTYTLFDLGSPTGSVGVAAVSINSSGQIVGVAVMASNAASHAVFWNNRATPPIDMGIFSGSNSAAYDIAASGVIVGEGSSATNTALLPAIWTNSAGAPIELATLGGSTGEARSMNTNGQIAGDTTIPSNGDRLAAYWANSSAAPVSLGTLGGGVASAALCINNLGRIVGYSHEQPFAIIHAALWTNSTSAGLDLGTLGGSNSQAMSINDLGQIVGSASTSNQSTHAALWTNSASPAIDLGTLGGAYSNSVALSINNLGQIVGYSYGTSTGLSHAVFWASRTSALMDLNGLVSNGTGTVLFVAGTINNLEEIVGESRIGVQTNAFVLVVTPTIQSIKVIGANVSLSFPTVSGAVYNVQSTTNLVPAIWSTNAANLNGTGTVLTNVDTGGAMVPKKFYRVDVQQ